MLELEVYNIAKRFDSRLIFSDISFSVRTGSCLAITGHNGSGKSTMIHILTGLGMASSGKLSYRENDQELEFQDYNNRMALVAPYLSLYESLTARENLIFYTKMAGKAIIEEKLAEIMDNVGLTGRADDPVGAFSSGMNQRLKFALAILRNPDILILDEPTAYLDKQGKKFVFDLIESLKSNTMIIMATNEEQEAEIADTICQLGR